MKLYLNNSKNNRSRYTKKKFKLERLLYIAFAILFVALIVVQAALSSPDARSYISSINTIDGAPMGDEEYLYKHGSIELELVNEESCPDLKVLVNGEERACFYNKKAIINVIDGDILEIDGSNLIDNINMIISSGSSNIEQDYIGKTVQIEKKVQKILKIRLS